jgi:hypothetical protein
MDLPLPDQCILDMEVLTYDKLTIIDSGVPNDCIDFNWKNLLSKLEFCISYRTGHFTPTVPATMAQKRANLSDVEENSDESNRPDNQFCTVNSMPFGYTEGATLTSLKV